MPEPVSTTVGICCLGYAALNAYVRPGSAVSSEAQSISRAAVAVMQAAERSQALFGGKTAAISQLLALAYECERPGWDGDESCGIARMAVVEAQDFLRAMPNDLPLPEFAPEPDGSVSLDWIQSQHRLFSLSIGGNGRLAYAWLDGSDRGHGVARFDRSGIPPRLLAGIRSITNHGDASLRAA